MRVEERFVCPFCGPAPQRPGEPLCCRTCGRRCGVEEARAARQAWRRTSLTLAEPALPGDGPAEDALVLVVTRSPLVAALASIVWLGGGHLYVGRFRAAAALAAAHLGLWLASGLGAPRVATAGLWAAGACGAAVTSARAARTAPGAVYRA